MTTQVGVSMTTVYEYEKLGRFEASLTSDTNKFDFCEVLSEK